ncbi:polyprenyl synthetase family protein [Massilia sp. ST3]|uniref:polyprenyl synthetase family protein n=1 Tax=Massilia sp. ST3 TaxID=2824903 RepID=UPI001B8222F6|nr:polyprenyl synthetase family protein [Massilia sp. ST3]MBQ5949261.1 polyprenyl synthetase family protein [Massilia sp. ST3]
MTTQTRRLGGFDKEKRVAAAPDELAALRHEIEQRIEFLLAEGGGQADLLTLAMRAGALSSGKRMRPLLMMLVARDLGCASPAVLDVACAVELVHAASLMLDDMPCMDNALLRRGKPAIHVQYGEDVTILAAVALLSRAFAILAAIQDIDPLTRTRLVTRLAETVGAQGLVRGQFMDLRGGAHSEAEIAATNDLKTGVLLGVAVDMAAILAQAEDGVGQALRAFALAAGQAFQIRDDFQDGPGNDSAITGKDTGKDAGKATFVNALGMDEARRRLAAHLHEADRHLGAALKGAPACEHRTRRFVCALFAHGVPEARFAPEIGALAYADTSAGAAHDARVN